MSVNYRHCKAGYRYVPTELADNRVKSKFVEGNSMYTHYIHSVPAKWVSSGLVKEIPEGVVDNDNR